MAPPRFDDDELPVPRTAANWWLRLVLGALLTVAVVLAGGYLAARYLLWPNIDRVAAHYAGSVGERIGAPLRWKSFSTEWRGWRPSLVVDGLTIGDGAAAARVERVSATLALRPLLAGRAAFHTLVLEGPTLPLIRDGSRLWPAALGRPADDPQRRPALEAFGWLLQQPDIRVGAGTVTIEEAGAPTRVLRLEQIAIVLRNGLNGSDLRIDVGRPGALAASLALQGEFSRRAFGDPADWTSWSADLRLEARRLVLETVRSLWPPEFADALRRQAGAIDWTSIAGVVDPTVTAVVERGKLQDARLRLRGDRFQLAAPGRPPVQFTRSHADVRLLPGPGGSQELTVGQLDFAEAGGGRIAAAAPNALTASFADDGTLARLAVGLDAVDLAPTLAALRRLAPEASALQRLTASGRLTQLRADWQARQGGDDPAFSVRANFERASAGFAPAQPGGASGAGGAAGTSGAGRPAAPPGSNQPAASAGAGRTAAAVEWPALRNLSGQIEATAATGQLVFRRTTAETEPSSLRFGGLFAEPEIPFDELDGRLSWSIDRSAGPRWLTVRVERFAFANADARGTLSGRLLGGGTESPIVDVRGRVERMQANRVWRYLPLMLAEPVRGWVREAFAAGQVEALDARWSGPLDGFPYRLKDGTAAAGGGQFRIAGKLRDVLFQYAKGWPAAHGVSGELVFDRASMRFTAERGRMLEVPLTNVAARIDDLADGLLEVSGRARGDAAQFLKFVTDSPLAAALGGAIAPIEVGGTSAVELTLKLPVRNAAKATLSGRADWTQGRFALAGSTVRLDEVNGGLAFTEQAIEFDRIAARLYGRPVDLSGRVARPGVLHLRADGRIDTAGLRGLVGDHPLYSQLDGSAPYQAQLDLADGGLRLQVDSDLVGLVSRMPAPVAKSADARRPFALTLEHRQDQPVERISATLGGDVTLIAERERAQARGPMSVTRAALAVNRQPVLPDQGLSLQVTEQRVDLDEWIAVLDGIGRGAAGGNPAVVSAALPVTVNLVADELRVSGRNFNRVVIGASRDGDRWNANVAAREINGHVNWTGTSLANGKLTARLGRLEIPQSERSDGDGGDGAATRLPALDIGADRFIFGGIDLGALTLLASHPAVPGADRGWTIDKLRLVNPGAEFEARGQWQRSTTLDFTLTVIDAGQLLERFQIRKAVKGGSGTLSGRLEWDGSPTSIDRARLGGVVDVAIKDGQFLKVEPGAAKLIGVLNLQALPKLLSLDFRDLFGEGFAFGELRGQVRIRRGIATTDSLAMRGLQAVVQIKGEADLKAQTQNLRVVVLPELNGGLATLAFAALVNPAVGLGALLAQSVLSEPLSRAFAYEVDVTGPWASPSVVERRRQRFGPPDNQ